MDSKIRLVVRAVIAIMCVGVAVCLAHGVRNVIDGKIVSVTPYNVTTSGSAEKTETNAVDNMSDTADVLIYNRNLFNQKSGMEEPEAEESSAEEADESPSEVEEIALDGATRPVLTDLRVLLKGTQVASDPRFSVAMFMPLEGGTNVRTVYLGEGGELLKEARIVKITRNRVYMVRTTHNDRLEYIDTRTTENDLEEARRNLEKQAEKERLAERDREKAVAAAAAADKQTAKGDNSEIVKKLSADTYEVSRSVIEQIRKNPNSLKNNSEFGALPKVSPVYKGANISGFRLLDVDSSSVYARLGLQSGDIIMDVNGQTIDSPQSAMALVDALNPDQNIALKINRKGSEKTITFQLK